MPQSIKQFPTNPNFAQGTKFRLIFVRSPKITYFCQAINLPGVSMSEILRPTPLSDYPIPGDKIQYDPLNITFLVDEELRSWFEIHDWVRGLTFPKHYGEYAAMLKEKAAFGTGGTSDASLYINTNEDTANMRIDFRNCFPISLSPLQFSAMDDANVTLTADVTIRYSYFDITRFPTVS